MLLVFKSCDHLHKCHSNLILNKAKCIDSLIATNSLSLATFPEIRQCYEQGKGSQTQTIYCYQRIYTLCFIENQIIEWHL